MALKYACKWQPAQQMPHPGTQKSPRSTSTLDANSCWKRLVGCKLLLSELRFGEFEFSEDRLSCGKEGYNAGRQKRKVLFLEKKIKKKNWICFTF